MCGAGNGSFKRDTEGTPSLGQARGGGGQIQLDAHSGLVVAQCDREGGCEEGGARRRSVPSFRVKREVEEGASCHAQPTPKGMQTTTTVCQSEATLGKWVVGPLSDT